MIIEFTEHALLRMKQKGLTIEEIEHVLTYPTRITKSGERFSALGICNNHTCKIIFIRGDIFIRIITIRDVP